MLVKFTDYLQLVKVIRMLYGLDVAKKYFEVTVNKYGLKIDVNNDKIITTTETLSSKE